jgi:molybdopterin synthase sulfur carrier subunit
MIDVRVRSILGIKEIVGRDELEVSLPQGSDLAALLSWMVARWGEQLAAYFEQAHGEGPLPRIRLLVNGKDIGFLDGMDTVLEDGDEILLLPPVAGG